MNPDMDVLLAPIAAEAACGADLSLTSLFDEIAEARRADDPSLAQGEWVTALKLADWPCVFERCHGALAKQTKDPGFYPVFTDDHRRGSVENASIPSVTNVVIAT